MKQSNAEKREFDEMMREEIESGNPFADGSYRTYKAKNLKKPSENKEIPKVENTLKNQNDEDLLF